MLESMPDVDLAGAGGKGGSNKKKGISGVVAEALAKAR